MHSFNILQLLIYLCLNIKPFIPRTTEYWPVVTVQCLVSIGFFQRPFHLTGTIREKQMISLKVFFRGSTRGDETIRQEEESCYPQSCPVIYILFSSTRGHCNCWREHSSKLIALFRASMVHGFGKENPVIKKNISLCSRGRTNTTMPNWRLWRLEMNTSSVWKLPTRPFTNTLSMISQI